MGKHVANALLEQCVRQLLGAGVHVGGLVQRFGRYANGQKRMDLVDVASGEVFEISQNLGGQSSGCCLNQQALAHAGSVLQRTLAAGVDMLAINRYGAAEAGGGGFAAEFAQAAALGTPIITVVGEEQRKAWAHFAADMAVELPLEATAAVHACLQRLGINTP